VLSPDVVKTISHEIELANMRKSDRSASSSTSSSTSPGGTKRSRKENASPSSSSTSSVPTKTPKTGHKKYKDNSDLIEKAKEKKKKYVHRDFFGRPVSSDVKGKKRVRAGPAVLDDDVENIENLSKKSRSKTDQQTGKKHLREEEENIVASLTMFKFTPGYTNAVKRRVNICEFL